MGGVPVFTDAQFVQLSRLLLKTVLWPGVWGVMNSGAAANDPLFWVMHQLFDKATHALRLSPVYNRGNLGPRARYREASPGQRAPPASRIKARGPCAYEHSSVLSEI